MIVHAAILREDVIWTGRRHDIIIQKICKELSVRPAGGKQGFIDHTGRFVDRVEGLAIALECGQLDIANKHGNKDELFSEDIYDDPNYIGSNSYKYPTLIWGPEQAKLWMVFEGGYDFTLAIIGRFPNPFPEGLPEGSRRHPGHNIECELEAVSLEDILDLGPRYGDKRDQEFIATFMLGEGIAPNQPFQVEIKLWYEGSTSMDWIGTAWETQCDWEIIGKEYIEPEDAVQRWAAYLEALSESN